MILQEQLIFVELILVFINAHALKEIFFWILVMLTQ